MAATAVSQQEAYQAGLIADGATGPNGEFIVPEHSAHGYLDSPFGAYAAPPHRLNDAGNPIPLEFRPSGENPPAEHFRHRDHDDRLRHSVETQDADGHTIVKERRGFVPHPLSVPSAEPRPTQQMSPSSYLFVRPFGQGFQRTFNGNHFSMADHRRDYEIGTVKKAVKSRRNTYRVEPSPWDADTVDMPANIEPDIPQGRITVIPLPPRSGSANRSFRLG
jgi:hypothetical protein